MTVAACVLLLLPLVDKYANPWAALVGGRSGSVPASWPAERAERRDRLMPDKYTALTPELYALRGRARGPRRTTSCDGSPPRRRASSQDVAVMQIGPDQGAFMTLLMRLIGARRALELGTFTGYSAICIARGPARRTACS